MGSIPDGSKIGDRSVVVGPTDADGNTILNRGGLAVGNGAKADSTSIAIGAHANAGSRPIPQQVPVVVNAPHGIAIAGGTVTNPTVNNYNPPERHLSVVQQRGLASSLYQKCTPSSFVSVVWEPDTEALGYASDFTAPLDSVKCLGYRAALVSRPPLIRGVTLITSDWNAPNPQAAALRSALAEAGIPFTAENGEIVRGSSVTVVVGTR
jgi:hypothetical protein